MQEAELVRAVSAAKSCAMSLALDAAEAVVIHESNRLAVRLLPCDVLARVRRMTQRAVAGAEFEVEVARRLAEVGSPVGELEPRVEPRVYAQDGFAVTFWRYYESVPPRDLGPDEYAQALQRLHAGMREVHLAAPHFTDRVAEAESLVHDRSSTPDLPERDRELLSGALRNLTAAIAKRGAPEQLLHGEPHPGNLLRAKEGPLFVDLETCCGGPVEFDLAHAPEAVSAHYPRIDRDLLGDCRLLSLAMVAAWRWDREDEFPDGRRMGEELLGTLRAALAGRPFDGGF